jgi:hypothetical protein
MRHLHAHEIFEFNQAYIRILLQLVCFSLAGKLKLAVAARKGKMWIHDIDGSVLISMMW